MNDEKEYLNIKEFAEKANRSQQSIYKRLNKLNNPLNAYVKKDVDGLKIRKDALKILYGVSDDENIEDNSTVSTRLIEEKTDKKEKKYTINENATTKLINILEKELEEQRKENELKNNLINDLQERLADSQRMLDQQQKLSMLDKQKILELEESTSKIEKKNFFQRIFGL